MTHLDKEELTAIIRKQAENRQGWCWEVVFPTMTLGIVGTWRRRARNKRMAKKYARTWGFNGTFRKVK